MNLPRLESLQERLAGARELRPEESGRRHALRVQRVCEELKHRSGTRPLSILKKSVGHHVPKRNDVRQRDDKLDVTDFDEILEIDLAAGTCTAEPGVTFVELVKATLPSGLVPAVVPELPTITVGGAVSGCSLESMSFKQGGFHDTCLGYELVTATGEVLECTPENEHRLIFQMLHGSFGTLGIITQLKFKLVPARPYVKLEHHRFSNLRDYKEAIYRHFRTQEPDFMDGFVRGPGQFVLSLGRFVSAAPYTHRYDWLQVYYKSAAERSEDYLETLQYLFRYDNGVTNTHPKSFLGRLLFGKFLHSAQLLRLAEKLPYMLPAKKPDVTVDLFIPFSRVDEFLDWYFESCDFVPLWMVPYRRVRDYEWIAPEFYQNLKDELFLDLAIYGMKQTAGRNYYQELEDELERVNGIKTLISYNYYDEERFWKIFNRPNHEAVKKITDPQNIFRDLWHKTCRAMQGHTD